MKSNLSFKSIVFYIILMCCPFFTISCDDNDNSLTPKGKTYLDYVREDYKTLSTIYPEAKDNLVEAQYTLNKAISDAEAKDIKPEECLLICYTFVQGHSEIYYLHRNFNTGEVNYGNYSADSPWTGDMKISENELKRLAISLDKAIELAKKDPQASESDGLNSKYVTLRKPLWPVWDNPQYVFGGTATRASHVFADAVSGKITVLDATDPNSDSYMYLVDDYNTMLDDYSNNEKLGFRLELQGRFVGAKYILNAPVNSLKAAELYPKEVTYTFYVPVEGENPSYVVQGNRKFIAGKQLETTAQENEVWSGDKFIDPNYLIDIISLDEAIYKLKISNVTDTDTDEVTLKWPEASPEWENPQYVFKGNNTPTVYVDAITGEVSTR